MGYLLGSSIAMIVMIWLVRDTISFRFQKKDLKNLVAFGLPLIPSTAAMVILRLSDRYIISALAGLEQVAVYDIGYKVGTLLTLLIGPFRNAWSPFAFSIAQKPEAPKIFRDVLAYVVAVSALFAIGLMAFRREIIFILAPSTYESAIAVVGWVAFAHIFIAAHPIISSSMVTQKKGGHLSWIATLAAAVNIALNFILIPAIGIIGAAIATFVGYAILSLLSYIVGRRWFDMQINWLRMGRIALAALPVVVGIRLVESADLSMWLAVTLKSVLLLAFPLLLLAVRFITMNQIQEMVTLLKSIMSRRKDKQAADADTV
jgi:O-antigen/teichoic acid export membrane protein